MRLLLQPQQPALVHGHQLPRQQTPQLACRSALLRQQQPTRPVLVAAAGAVEGGAAGAQRAERPGARPDDIRYEPRIEQGDAEDAQQPVEAEAEPRTAAGSGPVGYVEDERYQEQRAGWMPTVEWTPELEAQVGDTEYIKPFEGYTPHQLVIYEGPPLRHVLSVDVAAPVEKCFAIFRERLNWLQWFDLIHRFGFDPTDDAKAALYCFYQWGRMPLLELYFVLQREEEVPNARISERSVEGMPIRGAVDFAAGGAPGSTRVTLTLEYEVPTLLYQFVGEVGLYGSVNDILEENLEDFRAFAEAVDLDELEAMRREDRECYARNEDPPGAEEPSPYDDAYRTYMADQEAAAAAARASSSGRTKRKGGGGGGTRKASSKKK